MSVGGRQPSNYPVSEHFPLGTQGARGLLKTAVSFTK